MVARVTGVPSVAIDVNPNVGTDVDSGDDGSRIAIEVEVEVEVGRADRVTVNAS